MYPFSVFLSFWINDTYLTLSYVCIIGAVYDVVAQTPKHSSDPKYRIIVPKLTSPSVYCMDLVAIQVARLISFLFAELGISF
jgi:hypothetical protein